MKEHIYHLVEILSDTGCELIKNYRTDNALSSVSKYSSNLTEHIALLNSMSPDQLVFFENAFPKYIFNRGIGSKINENVRLSQTDISKIEHLKTSSSYASKSVSGVSRKTFGDIRKLLEENVSGFEVKRVDGSCFDVVIEESGASFDIRLSHDHSRHDLNEVCCVKPPFEKRALSFGFGISSIVGDGALTSFDQIGVDDVEGFVAGYLRCIKIYKKVLIEFLEKGA